MKKFLTRFREPSTWAGFGLLGGLFGIKELAMFGAPEVGVLLAALAAIVLPEQSE